MRIGRELIHSNKFSSDKFYFIYIRVNNNSVEGFSLKGPTGPIHMVWYDQAIHDHVSSK